MPLIAITFDSQLSFPAEYRKVEPVTTASVMHNAVLVQRRHQFSSKRAPHYLFDRRYPEQMTDLSRLQKFLQSGKSKTDSPPTLVSDLMRGLPRRTQFQLVILIPGSRMIFFPRQKPPPRCDREFLHRSILSYRLTIFPKRKSLIKCHEIGMALRGVTNGNPVPTLLQHRLQILLPAYHPHQNHFVGAYHRSILYRPNATYKQTKLTVGIDSGGPTGL